MLPKLEEVTGSSQSSRWLIVYFKVSRQSYLSAAKATVLVSRQGYISQVRGLKNVWQVIIAMMNNIAYKNHSIGIVIGHKDLFRRAIGRWLTFQKVRSEHRIEDG